MEFYYYNIFIRTWKYMAHLKEIYILKQCNFIECQESEATILTEAMPRSILLLKIHKTHVAWHHRSILALLYVKCLWSKHIGLWILILLSNYNTLCCHNSSTMMTGNIEKYWLVNIVFWISMHQYWRSCDQKLTNQLWLFTFDI